MKIAIFCMILIELARMINAQELDLSRLVNFEDSDDCIGCGYFPNKRNEATATEPLSTHVLTNNLLPAQNLWHWLCPCESQYGIVDLGSGKYPRYLAAASCVIKSCQGKFNQCKLIHYKVHVLRQRDRSDETSVEEKQYAEQSILPESLRVQWQFQVVKIGVACVAGN